MFVSWGRMTQDPRSGASWGPGRYRVAERPLRAVDPREWDAFAGAAGSTFQCAHAHLRRRQLGNLGHGKLLVIEVFDGPRKVAQAGALAKGDTLAIDNGLSVAPEHEGAWPEIMGAILAQARQRRFVYGGGWTVEPSRAAALQALPGVRVETVAEWLVQAVDFARWPDWDSYWRKVSDSVRYEARYAPERIPGFALRHFAGREILRASRQLAAIRRASYSHKRLSFDGLRTTLRFASSVLLAPELFELATVQSDEGVEALYFGTTFGENTCYLEGGIRQRRGMANWHLLREMTRAAYARAPRGKFLMGPVDLNHEPESGADQGLIRARRALRVSDFRVGRIEFTYDGAAGLS